MSASFKAQNEGASVLFQTMKESHFICQHMPFYNDNDKITLVHLFDLTLMLAKAKQ